MFRATPLRLRRIAALVALAAVGLTTACGEIRTVNLEPMAFESEAARIPGDVEVCIGKDLRSRQWTAGQTGYGIALGMRASQNFERLAKAAFRDAVTVFTETCGERTGRPWITASIVAAKRDWDGVEGIFSPEPVDTSITLSVELRANDGTEIWSTWIVSDHRAEISASEHATDLVLMFPFYWPRWVFGAGFLSLRGSRDFGIALATAFDEAHDQLMSSREVREAFSIDAPKENAEAMEANPATDSAAHEAGA